jgi:hypothetical protein
LSTFFASKFLFEDEHCTFPRTVVDDSIKERVRKWANKTKVPLRRSSPVKLCTEVTRYRWLFV